MSLTDAELLKLETQAKFNAVAFEAQAAWRSIVEALQELQERREKDTNRSTED